MKLLSEEKLHKTYSKFSSGTQNGRMTALRQRVSYSTAKEGLEQILYLPLLQDL